MNPQPGRPTVSVSRPPTNPFCRFLVLAVGLLSAAAAMMKPREYVRLPAAEPGQRGIPDFVPVLITFETFLGLWLISGALPRAARRVAIICFSTFACYTLYEALIGKADCGCFGQVPAKPWRTATLWEAVWPALVPLRTSTVNFFRKQQKLRFKLQKMLSAHIYYGSPLFAERLSGIGLDGVACGQNGS